MAKRIFLTLLVVASVLVLARTARAAEQTIRDKYRIIQVDRFEVSEGVKFPAEYLLALQEDVIQKLRKSNSFDEVLQPGENPTDPSAPVLRLVGTITHFKPGSRKKRYLAYGSGQTKIFARLTFSDRATGQNVVVQQVEGVLLGGFMGGSSKNVTHEFGKTVARNAKILLMKRLPPAGEAPVPETTTNVRSEKAERQALTITSKDFKGSEKKLNEEAAQGFRLVEFAVAGKYTAELTMEKLPAPARPPEYQIIRARLIGTLEKNLNRTASEGFCLAPHTLGNFGGWTIVIVERMAAVETLPRQYRIHSTMRISSLQQKIQKDQAEGYKLATTWEYPAHGHLAIMEKEASAD